MAFTLLDQGSFTSTGVGVKLSLPGGCDYFKLTNLTQLTATGNVAFAWEWFAELPDSGLTDKAGIKYYKAGGTHAVLVDTVNTNGFVYRESAPLPEAAKTGTTITQHATPVCTAVAHGYSTGDRVRIYNSTGMLQIAGMDFTVTRTGADTFTLDGINTSGFAAGATAFTARRLPSLQEVEPGALFITAISNAASAVVRTSVEHNFKVGQLVNFSVPAEFGMTEINGMTGKVTAEDDGVVTSNTFVVDIDTTGFTTFAFPASGSVPDTRFAQVSAAGQRNTYNVTEVPFHTGQFYPYMFLTGGADAPAGANADEIIWQAWRKEA